MSLPCPELLLRSTERSRHYGAVQITPKQDSYITPKSVPPLWLHREVKVIYFPCTSLLLEG